MLLKWAQSPNLNVFFIILQLWEYANIIARFGMHLPGKNEKLHISFQLCKVSSLHPSHPYTSHLSPLTSPEEKKKERKNNKASRGTGNIVKGQSRSLWQLYKSALLSRLLGNSPWKQDQTLHKGPHVLWVATLFCPWIWVLCRGYFYLLLQLRPVCYVRVLLHLDLEVWTLKAKLITLPATWCLRFQSNEALSLTSVSDL